MTIAPVPNFPERAAHSFGVAYGQNRPGNKGEVRFEEGLSTDTDRPSDFMQGAYGDPIAAPGTMNHPNPGAQFKHADETQRERAHMGSSAWLEAPTILSDFVDGASSGQSMPQFEQIGNPGTRQARRSPTVITD